MASTKFEELLNGEEVAADRAHSTPERGGYSDARVGHLLAKTMPVNNCLIIMYRCKLSCRCMEKSSLE